jgi:hypothetical protein
MNKTPELRERCAEILAWKSSGILEGNALRAYAEKLRGKFGGVFDAGEALSFAEKETARELMEMAVAAVPIDVDALAQEIRRVDGNHDKGAGALAEALMPFLTAALQSAAEAPPPTWERDEPVGYVTKDELTLLLGGASCVDLFGRVVPKGFEMVPLYEHPAPREDRL